MKTNIVYFSRSGRTQAVAEKLTNVLNTTSFQINDNMNWKGIFGYLKGGFYAASNKHVDITFDPSCLDCDHLLILSPLWAGGAAPAIRTFMNENPHNNISLLLTNDGSDVKKAFAKVKIVHPEIKNFYGITKNLKNEDDVIKTIQNNTK